MMANKVLRPEVVSFSELSFLFPDAFALALPLRGIFLPPGTSESAMWCVCMPLGGFESKAMLHQTTTVCKQTTQQVV
jgi:hypothetical protein